MLPGEIQSLAAPVVRIYEQLTDDLMLNVARQLAWYGDMTATAEWQMKKLAQLGQLDQKNIKTIAAATKVCPQLTYYAVENAALKAIAELEPAFRAAAAASLASQTVTATVSPGIMQALTYYQQQARDTLNLVNTVMAYKTRDAYTGIVNKVVDIVNREEYLATLGKNTASVVTGAQSRTTALRQCIREFSRKGIPGFVDRAKREWSPEAYLNMDVRTTVNNVAHQAQFARMDDYGVDLIEVSSHAAARPLCAPFQGRLYSRSGGSGFTTDLHGNRIYYGSWKETSYGEPAGLLGINCGHQIYPFFPGLSTQTYEPTKDPETNDRAYEIGQKQRYLERQLRYTKRECAMLDAMGDKEGFDAAGLRLKQRQQALRDFTASTGRTLRLDRGQVSGYNRSVAAKAAAGAKRAEFINDIRGAGEFPKSAHIHLTPAKIDISSLSFDSAHINGERGHNVTEQQARAWIENAKISVTVWKGQFERYYAADGAAYVDLSTKEIRTAFPRAQFGDKTTAVMEVIKKHG